MKPLKTIVYVDGFNLYYRLRRISCKWLDIGTLLNLILSEDYNIIGIKYFTALVKSTVLDPSKAERQMTYWRALDSIPKLEIVKGRFKKRSIKGEFLDPLGKGIERRDIVRISKFEEKESDVNIASHILVDCFRKKFDCVVLLSNDTDLKAPLGFARKEYKKIGVISPHQQQRIHQDLQKVSHFSKSISDETLKKCQFPEKVGRVKKPSNW